MLQTIHPDAMKSGQGKRCGRGADDRDTEHQARPGRPKLADMAGLTRRGHLRLTQPTAQAVETRRAAGAAHMATVGDMDAAQGRLMQVDATEYSCVHWSDWGLRSDWISVL